MPKPGNKFKCPSVGEWINEGWYIYITEYYSAIKKNEILIPATIPWMNFKCILPNQRGLTQKSIYYVYASIPMTV